MTRAEIEAAIAEKRQEYETEHAAALSLERECQRIYRELERTRAVLLAQQRRAEGVVRELAVLDRLLCDADEPQFPVIAGGIPHMLIIVAKTPARVYVRFAGNRNYGDYVDAKGKTRAKDWTLDTPAFLAWAKEQQV